MRHSPELKRIVTLLYHIESSFGRFAIDGSFEKNWMGGVKMRLWTSPFYDWRAEFSSAGETPALTEAFGF
jgi:hypothetical protein